MQPRDPRDRRDVSPPCPLRSGVFGVVQTGRSSSIGGAYKFDTEYRQTSFDLGGRIGRFVGATMSSNLLASRRKAARQDSGTVSAHRRAGSGSLVSCFRVPSKPPRVSRPHISEGPLLLYGTVFPICPLPRGPPAICGPSRIRTPEAVTGKIHAALSVRHRPSRSAVSPAPSGDQGPARPSRRLSPDTIKSGPSRTLTSFLALSCRQNPTRVPHPCPGPSKTCSGSTRHPKSISISRRSGWVGGAIVCLTAT